MIEINTKKPLQTAILNGENIIKIKDPNFLVACYIAERCENNKDNVKNFLNFAMNAKNKYYSPKSTFKVGIAKGSGTVHRKTVNLTMCANAMGIIDILNNSHSSIKLGRDEEGNLTGLATLG